MKKYCYTFLQFSSTVIKITKQLTEYCNFTSLKPKKTEVGDKLCQHVDAIIQNEP